jgi:hypothetical protein
MRRDKRTYLRGFAGVGDIINEVTDPIFKKKGYVQSQLYTKWPEMVGEDLAVKISPGKVYFPRGEKTGATLQVFVYGCDSLEIMHLSEMIIERMAIFFGYKAVAKLKILQKPLNISDKRHSVQKVVANKADQITMNDDLLQTVEDDELRSALARLHSSVK